MQKKIILLLKILIIIFCGLILINKIYSNKRNKRDQQSFAELKKDFLFAEFINCEYHIWNNNEYYIINYESLAEKYPALKSETFNGNLEFTSQTDVDMKLIDNETILIGGLSSIFYINFKENTLLRHIKMPKKEVLCFDIINDKDLIFIYDGEILTYNYETDTIKNCNINDPKNILNKHPRLNIPKMVYSKKYNAILYSVYCDSNNPEITSEIFCIDLNKNKINKICKGWNCINENDGHLYYSDKTNIYEYFPNENKSVEIFKNTKSIFDYSNTINWFKKIDDYFFIISYDHPNFKGIPESILFIYNKKQKMKLRETIKNYDENIDNSKNSMFNEYIDVIKLPTAK